MMGLVAAMNWDSFIEEYQAKARKAESIKNQKNKPEKK